MMIDLSTAFSKKKALVTGGSGFIGSNLARRLVSLGTQVTVVDNFAPNLGGNPYNLHDI
jgi:UDP-glucose 4-epimerase